MCELEGDLEWGGGDKIDGYFLSWTTSMVLSLSFLFSVLPYLLHSSEDKMLHRVWLLKENNVKCWGYCPRPFPLSTCGSESHKWLPLKIMTRIVMLQCLVSHLLQHILG